MFTYSSANQNAAWRVANISRGDGISLTNRSDYSRWGVPHFSRLSRSANHGGLRHASILKLPTVGRRTSGKLPEVRHPNCFSLPTRHNQSLPQKLATRPRNSRSLGSGIRGQKARNLQLRAGQAFGHASGYRVNLRERALKSPFHSTLVPVSKFGVFAPSHRPKRYKTSRSRS